MKGPDWSAAGQRAGDALGPPFTPAALLACSFGKDTEESIVMTLSHSGVTERAGLPLEGMAVHLKALSSQQH